MRAVHRADDAHALVESLNAEFSLHTRRAEPKGCAKQDAGTQGRFPSCRNQRIELTPPQAKTEISTPTSVACKPPGSGGIGGVDAIGSPQRRPGGQGKRQRGMKPGSDRTS